MTEVVEHAQELDREAFSALAQEFGGLAGWWVRKQDGEWSEERWDEAMIRLYQGRDDLDDVEGQGERGHVALQAFSAGEPDTAMLDRIERMLIELPVAA